MKLLRRLHLFDGSRTHARLLETYRVAIQRVLNLLLTSKQKFRFGLARPGQAQAIAELLFCSQREVLHKLNGHLYRIDKLICRLQRVKVDT